jgi:hypothetical protein
MPGCQSKECPCQLTQEKIEERLKARGEEFSVEAECPIGACAHPAGFHEEEKQGLLSLTHSPVSRDLTTHGVCVCVRVCVSAF